MKFEEVIELEEDSPHKTNETTQQDKCSRIPDGGVRAWIVCLTCSLTLGTIFSILNSFGIMFSAFEKEYMSTNSTGKSLKASSVWSLATGLTFGLSPVVSVLIDRFGIRRMTFLGGALAFCGMLLTSFMPSYHWLYLTYGVMFGSGISFMNTGSVIILGHYFKRRLGRANGLVMAGSGCLLIGAPYLHKLVIRYLGLRHDFHILSGLLGMFMVYALVWKPTFTRQSVTENKKSDSSEHSRLERIKLSLNEIVRFENLKNKNFVVWMMAMVICNFSYYISFVHLVNYVEQKNPNFDGPGLLTILSIGSLLSRAASGILADHRKISRIFMLQVSFAIMGSCLCFFPLVNSYVGMAFLTFTFGLCDGCRITMLGPITFDIVGIQGVSQAVGLLLGLSSIPFMSGPSIAGFLYDQLGTYDIAYYVAGIPPIFAANLLFFIQIPRKISEKSFMTEEMQYPRTT